MLENKLRENIVQARNFNSYGSISVLIIFAATVWFYEYTNIDMPMYVNTFLIVLCLVISPFFVDKANKLTVAKCPKCKSIVEKGRFIGSDFPERCTNWGSQTLKLD
jgi:hypothetical protein